MHTPASPRLVGPALTGGWSACFSALFWLAFFASPSTAQIAPLTLAANVPTGHQGVVLDPLVVGSSAGGVVVTRRPAPGPFLEARFFSKGGTLLGTRLLGDQPVVGFDATVTTDDLVLIAWAQQGIAQGEVVAQWFSSTGGPLSGAFPLGNGAGLPIDSPPAAACNADGCLVVWDVLGGDTRARRLVSGALPAGPVFSLPGTGRPRPRLALADDGRIALGWLGSRLVFLTDGVHVFLTDEPVPFVQGFDAEGFPVGEPFTLVGEEPQFKRAVSLTRRVQLAWNAAGELVALWDRSVYGELDRVFARHLSDSAQPLGPPVEVDAQAGAQSPALARLDAADNFVTAWTRAASQEVVVRVLDATGAPLAPAMVASGVPGVVVASPALTGDGAERLWLVWQSGAGIQPKQLHLQPWLIGEPTCSRPFEIPDGSIPCAELLGGRFKAFGSFRRPDGSPTEAPAYPETDRAAFVFFNNIFNPEVAVKMLDGRPVNGNFWFFYGAMSNQEYVLSVYDRETSATRVYYNPPGRLASVGDTAAFPGSAGAAPVASPESSDEERAWTALELAPETVVGKSVSAVCAPSATVLCLQSGRFSVAVDWRVSPTSSGQGQMEPLTDQGGYVTFFNPANIELALKVLDGTAINGHFWVFYASMTNVEFELTVRDLHTGAVYVRRNPPRTLASVADTNAL